MLIGYVIQAFWLSPISSFVHTKLLQAPSGHAFKGCWPVRHRMCRCKPNRFSWYLSLIIQVYCQFRQQ